MTLEAMHYATLTKQRLSKVAGQHVLRSSKKMLSDCKPENLLSELVLQHFVFNNI